MPVSKEKYRANRNEGDESSEASKKTAKVVAKGAADYFTAGKGGAIVDKLSDTKLGDAILSKAGKAIDKAPIVNNLAQKLNDSGALDTLDQGLSMMENGGAKGLENNKTSSATNSGLGKDSKTDLFNKGDNNNSFLDSSSSKKEGDTSLGFSGNINLFDIGSWKIKGAVIAGLVLFMFLMMFLTIIGGSDENGTDPATLHAEEKEETEVSSGGSCVYDIKGFKIGSNIYKKKMTISKLKVRLMECGSPYGNGSYSTALNEPLVDFETYLAGVAYAEISSGAPKEAIKAQIVAARSYSLARPTAMNNSYGKKLEEENGQWILQISSCVADQVFCNIDEGCSYMGGGDGQGGIVRSGNLSGAIRTRTPLATNHILRAISQEVKGEVLVDKSGYIISAGYLSTEQNMFISMANNGMNYKQILLQVYNQGNRNYGAADIEKMSCSSGSNVSTGDFASWKQYGSSWSSIPLGSSTSNIGKAGCLVTSISMLIAKSGVSTNVDGEFNPGTFVQKLNANGGFIGANLYWGKVSVAAPSFVYQNKIYILNLSKQEKLAKINSLLNSGYYVVAEVKGNTGQHWVAIDSTSGDTVNMMDPGSTATNLWSQYNWANTSTLAYFKVS